MDSSLFAHRNKAVKNILAGVAAKRRQLRLCEFFVRLVAVPRYANQDRHHFR